LQRTIRWECAFKPFDESQKCILEIVPVNDLVASADGRGGTVLGPNGPTLLGVRFVEQTASHAFVEITRRTLVFEVVVERLPI